MFFFFSCESDFSLTLPGTTDGMSDCWSVTVAVDAKDPVVDVGAVYRAFLRMVEARERSAAPAAGEVFLRWSHGRVVGENGRDLNEDDDDDDDDDSDEDDGDESSGSDSGEDDNNEEEVVVGDAKGRKEKEEGAQPAARAAKDADSEDFEDGTDADRADDDDDDDDDEAEEAEEGDEQAERRMRPDERARLLERQRERLQRGSQARTANVISNIMARLGDEGALVEELAGYDMEDSFIDDSELTAPPARKKARHSGSSSSSSSDSGTSSSDSSSSSSDDDEGTRAPQRHRHRHRHRHGAGTRTRGEQASQEVDDPDAFAVGLGLPEPVFQALRDYRNSLLYSLHSTHTHMACLLALMMTGGQCAQTETTPRKSRQPRRDRRLPRPSTRQRAVKTSSALSCRRWCARSARSWTARASTSAAAS